MNSTPELVYKSFDFSAPAPRFVRAFPALASDLSASAQKPAPALVYTPLQQDQIPSPVLQSNRCPFINTFILAIQTMTACSYPEFNFPNFLLILCGLKSLQPIIKLISRQE